MVVEASFRDSLAFCYETSQRRSGYHSQCRNPAPHPRTPARKVLTVHWAFQSQDPTRFPKNSNLSPRHQTTYLRVRIRTAPRSVFRHRVSKTSRLRDVQFEVPIFGIPQPARLRRVGRCERRSMAIIYGSCSGSVSLAHRLGLRRDGSETKYGGGGW